MTFIKIVSKMIKCPLFCYAEVDFDKRSIKIKRKPFKMFFTSFGQRVVRIKDEKE